MRAVSQRIVWIIGLLCLFFGVAGLAAFSPVTVALAVTGWFLCKRAERYLKEQADIQASTPDLQYWARSLLFRTFGLMVLGAIIAAGCVVSGFSLHLSFHAQVLLTAVLVTAMVVVTKLTLPGFFAASWEVHGARERRKLIRSSMLVSRFIVRAVASLVLVVSLVGSFALLQSIRLGAPRAGVALLQSKSIVLVLRNSSPSGSETR